MNSSHDQQQQSNLEDILKELEERFGISETQHKPHTHKKNEGINFAHWTQNQIIGGLTLMLLVVGGAVGMFLSNQNQEIRQQASVAYPKCMNTTGVCSNGADAGSPCVDGTGAPGTCQNTETSGICTCVKLPEPTPDPTPIPICLCGLGSDGQCVGKDVNSACTSGGQAFYCSTGANPVVDPTGGYYCTCIQNPSPICPGGGTGATSTPTRTPTIPQATSVLPTNPPATNPPATNTPVPPTNVPPTTTVAPTCNGITMTYGLPNEVRPPRVNDQVTFTCSQIAGAFRYEFRLFRNGVEIPNALSPTASGANISNVYTIALSGNYSAQCRMCTGTASSTCQPWEQL